ncbi:MAG: LamG-like jellyroll fold domain-containing protein [Phycisphaerae bacterium]
MARAILVQVGFVASLAIAFGPTAPASAQCGMLFATPTASLASGYELASGDFNSDGIVDLATTTVNTNVEIRFGNGDGTFRFGEHAAALGDCHFLRARDFNRDGYPDLVVTHYNQGRISLSLGNGDGTFQPPAYFTVGNRPSSVTADYLNGDGLLDLVVTHTGESYVSVLMGTAGNSFAPPVNYNVNTSSHRVVTGYFGGGSVNPGFAVITAQNRLVIFHQDFDGGGVFIPGPIHTTVDPPSQLVTADFNEDGRLDIAVGINTRREVWVYLGIPGGVSSPTHYYAGGGDPRDLDVADFNGDGHLDLAVSFRASSGGFVWILPGNGDGGFQTQVQLAMQYGSSALAVDDFNGDHQPDLAVGGFDLYIYGVLNRVNNCFIDRNDNGVHDLLDIARGVLSDCNGDQIPDDGQHLNTPPEFNGSPALEFNGANQYVEIPYSVGNNPSYFTVECWVKYDGALGQGGHRSPLTSRATDLRGYLFYLAPTDRWEFWNGGGPSVFWNILSGPVVERGVWTHLAATYANGRTAFLVNGAQVASTTGFQFVRNPQSPMRIGAGDTEGGVQYYFPGQVDDVRVWNYARPATEVTAGMYDHLLGSEPGLTTLYQLDSSGGTAAMDAGAGFNAHGTLINQPTWTAPYDCYPFADDLNHNGVLDATDIANQTSSDCNANSVIDEVEHLSQPVDFDGSASLRFNGAAQYVQVPYTAANNPPSFTVELWVKLLGGGSIQSPLTSRSATADQTDLRGYLFYKVPAGRWEFWTGDGPGSSWTSLAGPTAVTGAWTHLAATYDNFTGVTTLYVNGTQAAMATGFRYTPNSGAPLRIGAGTTDTTPNALFNGQIDDVRIWDFARTPSQVAQSMYERLSGGEYGLISLYQLDESTGAVVGDSAGASGNANGTIINQATWMAAVDCEPCPGDVDGDRQVSLTDLATLLSNYGSTGSGIPGDVDSDADVDLADLALLLINFGQPCP